MTGTRETRLYNNNDNNTRTGTWFFFLPFFPTPFARQRHWRMIMCNIGAGLRGADGLGNAICNGSPRITYESVVLFSHFLANPNKKFNIFVFYRIRGAPSTLGPAPAGGCGFGRVSRCWRVDSRVHLRFSVALCSFITITEFLNVTYTAHFYCMSSVGYRSKAFYEYNTAIGVNGLDWSSPIEFLLFSYLKHNNIGINSWTAEFLVDEYQSDYVCRTDR